MEQIDKRLEELVQELGLSRDGKFFEVYETIPNENLRSLLAHYHEKINEGFDILNGRIVYDFEDGGNSIRKEGYFKAEDSRNLLYPLRELESLINDCRFTKYSFEVCNNDYAIAIKECLRFLRPTGGSVIPKTFRSVAIENIWPIFKMKNSIELKPLYASLKLIGEGSYAEVFSYVDPNYGTTIALKRAKPDLNEKEIERFKKEFAELKKLKSPYIIEVYSYNDEKKQYTMEKMDESVYSLISRTAGHPLSIELRKRIVYQLAKGLSYIHSKGLLHRDISLNNVFIKNYDGLYIAKIGDFGLVKTHDSTKTSLLTEIKGTILDPELFEIGFKQYGISHEIYAFTKLCVMILTWKKFIDIPNQGAIKEFLDHGTSKDKNKRFKSTEEIADAVRNITDKEIEKASNSVAS